MRPDYHHLEAIYGLDELQPAETLAVLGLHYRRRGTVNDIGALTGVSRHCADRGLRTVAENPDTPVEVWHSFEDPGTNIYAVRPDG